MRLYNVVTKKGYDVSEIEAELCAVDGKKYIPSRPVNIEKPLAMSKRVTVFKLTDEEAAELANDERLQAVSLHVSETDAEIRPVAKQTGNYDMNNFAESDYPNLRNWGQAFYLQRNNYFDADGKTGSGNNKEIAFNSQGENVDIVIMDSGIQGTHPDFKDKNGNSRIIKQNWWDIYALLNPNQDKYTHPNFPIAHTNRFYYDMDLTHWHGTACASIAAGTLYGIAKKANIYVAKIDIGMPYFQIDPDDWFNMLIYWHKQKINGNPTVVSNSWGLFKPYSTATINQGGYADEEGEALQGWVRAGRTDQQIHETYKIKKSTTHTFLDPAYQVLLEEMIDAGIHIATASGNGSNRTVTADHPEYNNYYDWTGTITSASGMTINTSGRNFYNQPNSPYPTADGFLVGALAQTTTEENGEQKMDIGDFSNRGQAIDIYAAGRNVIAATNYDRQPPDPTLKFDDPRDSNFKVAAFSGTSAACPAVAGVMACYLSVNPELTPKQLKQFILDNATTGNIHEDASGFFSDNGFVDSNNRILYNKYNQNNVLSISGLSKFKATTKSAIYEAFVNFRASTFDNYYGTRTSVDGSTIFPQSTSAIYEDSIIKEFYVRTFKVATGGYKTFFYLGFKGDNIINGNFNRLIVKGLDSNNKILRSNTLSILDAEFDDVDRVFSWTQSFRYTLNIGGGEISKFKIGIL
jgi:subtilisin family serine protease